MPMQKHTNGFQVPVDKIDAESETNVEEAGDFVTAYNILDVKDFPCQAKKEVDSVNFGVVEAYYKWLEDL